MPSDKSQFEFLHLLRTICKDARKRGSINNSHFPRLVDLTAPCRSGLYIRTQPHLFGAGAVIWNIVFCAFPQVALGALKASNKNPK